MSDPLVEVQEVSWRYVGTDCPALQNISFQIAPGEVVGVTGPSGAGKTTLCLALRGLIPHNFRGDFEGQVLIHGEATAATGLAALVQKVGIMFQDPETQFVGLSVEEEMVFALENLGMPDVEIERRIMDALRVVRMESFLDRSPFALSGGEKQKVAIASLLALQPELLVLDEPTSELDPLGAEGVFSVLKELKKQRMTSILLVSHATEEMAAFADRIVLLYQGKLVCDRPVDAFMSDIEMLQTYGVRPPQVTELAYPLRAGDDTKLPLTVEEAVEFLRPVVADLGWEVQ